MEKSLYVRDKLIHLHLKYNMYNINISYNTSISIVISHFLKE